MKLEIQIQKETGIYAGENIAEITINNGNWKYWDKYTESTFKETHKKQTLTMNNLHDAIFLHQPVKDAFPHFDEKMWAEKGELIQDDAYVRPYNTLIGYLNCRIGNLKEKYKKWGRTEQETTAVLFEKVHVKSNEASVTDNLQYEVDGLMTIKIKVVE